MCSPTLTPVSPEPLRIAQPQHSHERWEDICLNLDQQEQWLQAGSATLTHGGSLALCREANIPVPVEHVAERYHRGDLLFLCLGANPDRSWVLERRTQKWVSKSPLIFGLSLLESHVPSAEASILALSWLAVDFQLHSTRRWHCSFSHAMQSDKVSAVTQLSKDLQQGTGPGDSGSSKPQRGQQAVAQWVQRALPITYWWLSLASFGESLHTTQTGPDTDFGDGKM